MEPLPRTLHGGGAFVSPFRTVCLACVCLTLRTASCALGILVFKNVQRNGEESDAWENPRQGRARSEGQGKGGFSNGRLVRRDPVRKPHQGTDLTRLLLLNLRDSDPGRSSGLSGREFLHLEIPPVPSSSDVKGFCDPGADTLGTGKWCFS